ncbi:DUF1461 domain-containing protein [Candidatus Woesearchaeota archaeon]|nr:DUF1461 domain-containing protein [Candidatus Woesearchaeota archaeon]
MNNALRYATVTVLAVSLAFLIVAASFTSVFLDQGIYRAEFAKTGAYERAPDADSLNSEVLDYLKGNGNIPMDFSEREKSHLADVKQLIRAFFVSALGAAAVAIAASVTLALLRRLLAGFTAATILGSLFILLAMGVLWILPFGWVFDNFHLSLFQPGTYLFEESDLLIKLYPAQFFQDFAMIIALRTAVLSGVLLVVAVLLRSFVR